MICLFFRLKRHGKYGINKKSLLPIQLLILISVYHQRIEAKVFFSCNLNPDRMASDAVFRYTTPPMDFPTIRLGIQQQNHFIAKDLLK